MTHPLEDELRALGRSIATPPVDAGLATAVLDRVAGEPVGRPSLLDRLRARWRAVVAALLVLLGGLALAPPVRATVADWFGLGGVVVRQAPGSGPSTAPPPPSVGTGRTVEEAGRLAGFTPFVPAALGPPAGVEVSADRRMVSMTWSTPDGTVRLDQFGDKMSPMFVKSVYGRFELTKVGAADAYWFAEPHDLVLIDSQGVEHTEEARTAGATLVWVSDGLTLRLEGDLPERRAIEIAESAVRR